MLEAVNSVVQTAPFVRANAEQVSSANSYSANPNQVQKAAQVPYVSPYFTVDASDNQIVMEIRNPSTGAILQSYPTETQIQDRRTQAQQNATVSSASRNEDDAAAQSPQVAASVGYSSGNSGGTGQTRPAATNRQIAAFTAASQSGQQSHGSSSSVSLVA